MGKQESKLMEYVETNNLTALTEELNNMKDKPDKSTLNLLFHTACLKGNKPMAQKLLDTGADLCSLIDLDKPYETKYTSVLHRALLGGHLLLTQFLLDAGALPLIEHKAQIKLDLDTLLEPGATPLWCAIKGKLSRDEKLTAVRMILEKGGPKGINLESKFNGGLTILHMAAEEGLGEVVRELIIRHADTNVRDNKGKGIVHYAAEGHMKLVAYQAIHCNMRSLNEVYNVCSKECEWMPMLKKLDFDLNMTDHDGNTGLHSAAYIWSFSSYHMGWKTAHLDYLEAWHKTFTYKTLVTIGMDPQKKNKNGYIPDQVIEKGVVIVMLRKNS